MLIFKNSRQSPLSLTFRNAKRDAERDAKKKYGTLTCQMVNYVAFTDGDGEKKHDLACFLAPYHGQDKNFKGQ